MKSLYEFYDHANPLLAFNESCLTDIEEAVCSIPGFTYQEALRQAMPLRFAGDSDLAKSCRQRIEKIKQAAAETE